MEIKFDYILKERFSGKLIHRIFTIEELEQKQREQENKEVKDKLSSNWK